MNHYTITRIKDKPDWSNISALQVNNYLWTAPLDIKMTAQICYNDNAMFVHLRAWEKYIRAVHNQPLSQVCEDSCMEFFFRPCQDDLRYFNFEINPNGQTYIGFGANLETLVRLIPQDEEQLFQKHTSILKDGWEATFSIPFSFIQIFYPHWTPAPGMVLYANCYKCGNCTIHPHYISWNPLNESIRGFHRPREFGALLFGK